MENLQRKQKGQKKNLQVLKQLAKPEVAAVASGEGEKPETAAASGEGEKPVAEAEGAKADVHVNHFDSTSYICKT